MPWVGGQRTQTFHFCDFPSLAQENTAPLWAGDPDC